MRKLIKLGRVFAALFSENKITQASAALSYYLTMTVFPTLIVVYALLGSSYERLMSLLGFAEKLVASEIIGFITEFLGYVAENQNPAMLPIGLTVLVSYASAAIRAMQGTIGSIQGGAEYKGLRSYFISVVYSLMLLSVLYFALLAMLTGRGLVEKINACLPGMAFLFDWLYLRYLILAGIMLLFLLGLFHVPKRREDKYRVLPGAVLSTAGMVLISPLFSMVISSSVKYSLVYGSLASVILLMLWLYMCCMVIYSGVVFNVALYRCKKTQD